MTSPPVEDRARGKHILTLMTYLPVEDIKAVWKSMSKAHRAKFFGNGHAEELDRFVGALGKSNADHLTGDFAEKLRSLNNGNGMDDHKAARVLHTPSGVRLAHRALTLNPASEAYRSTVGILNGRHAAEMKKS